MTKTFETIYRDNVSQLIQYLEEHTDEVRGEFVLVVGPYTPSEDEQGSISPQAQQALAKLIGPLKVKEACQVVADLTGESRNRLYDYALTLKQQQ